MASQTVGRPDPQVGLRISQVGRKKDICKNIIAVMTSDSLLTKQTRPLYDFLLALTRLAICPNKDSQCQYND